MLVLFSCTPEGGYTDDFIGVIEIHEEITYIHLPNIGLVVVPESESTYFIDPNRGEERDYQLQEGDLASMAFLKTEDLTYINEGTPKTFKEPATIISVYGTNSQNVRLVEVEDGYLFTLHYESEFDSIEVGGYVYSYEFKRFDNGGIGDVFYRQYLVSEITPSYLWINVPNDQIEDLLRRLEYEGLTFSSKLSNLPIN